MCSVRVVSVLAMIVSLGVMSAPVIPVWAEPDEPSSARMWKQLVADAARLQLPTGFLAVMPPEFVRFEFDDLRSYAAEYHPSDHRLVLNRSLSFNAAGGTLRPLSKLTHKELEVLYHELFHAYMDYLTVRYEQPPRAGEPLPPLLIMARRYQRCRYGDVAITPVVQRPEETEVRYLTESESWEALNETWAVFVGWAIWNQLEMQKKSGGDGPQRQSRTLPQQWGDRLEKAVRRGDLRGYYVPEDPDELRVTHKRFLAREFQISGPEASALMTQILGFPEQIINTIQSRPGLASFFQADTDCQETPR